ncbi:MAG: gliding motility-associated C-terminal domain-containing protein [Bacteroidales bacterium]|nr:gliding motility-associated C-terminal domain-containing protein [Bacteroidales bacterium]
MAKILKKIVLLVALICGCASAWCQVSTRGTSFWVAFLPMAPVNTWSSYFLAVNPSQSGTLTITNPNTGWTQNVPLQANVQTYYSIPSAQAYPTLTTNSPAGLYVTSTVPIDLYAYNRCPSPTAFDAALVLPVEALGKDYRILTYKTQPSDAGSHDASSDFVVVGTEDNTMVTVRLTASANSGSIPSGAYYGVVNRGEVMVFHSQIGADYTNSTVSANKKVAVFMGNALAKTTSISADHTYTQALPISSWGTEYVAIPDMAHNNDKLKLAVRCNGSVTINNGVSTNTFSVDTLTGYLSNLTTASVITADVPICVGQFHPSRTVSNQGGDWGDVAFTTLIPMDHGVQSARISKMLMDCRSNYAPKYYINLATHTADTALMTLDGAPLHGFTPIAGSAYSYLRREVSIDNHEIASTASAGFAGFCYGTTENWGAYYAPLGGIVDTVGVSMGDTNHVSLSECGPVFYGGLIYTASGDYLLPGTLCTGPTMLHVSVGSTFDTTIQVELTNTDYLWMDGTTYSHSVDTLVTLPGADGCDSIFRLHLVIHHVDTVAIDTSHCGPLTIGSRLYLQSGHFESVEAHGDDTTYLFLDVHIFPTYDTLHVYDLVNDSLLWIDGNTYSQSINTALTLTTVDGCDSIVRLHLVIHHVDTVAIDTSHCGPLTIGPHTYHQSGHFESVEAHGDDTTYLFLDVHIYPTYDTTEYYHLINDSLLWIDGNIYAESTNEPMVTYASINGCDSIVRLSLIVERTYDIWVPNAFTPDLTNNNVFKVFSNGVRTMTVTLYQRWGERFYEFDGLHGSWDGTYKGRKCPMGAYVYRIDFEPIDSYQPHKPIVGTVTLIR